MVSKQIEHTMKGGWLLWLFLVMVWSWQAEAAPNQSNRLGTYSSLSCHSETGDILGMEITFIPSYQQEGYVFFALVQFAEGVAMQPQLVPVQWRHEQFSMNISFMIYQDLTFTGKIMDGSLVGQISSPLNMTVNLPKRTSLWAKSNSTCLL